MKLRLMDLLQCTDCETSPLALYVVRAIADQAPVSDVVPSRACTVHCAGGEQDGPRPCSRCLDEEVEEGLILCDGCGRWFPVVGGVASMLPDELREPSEAQLLEGWREALPEEVYARAMRSSARPDCGDENFDGAGRDKLSEIELRDREAGIYDDLFPDRKFRAEIETYLDLFRPEAGVLVLDLGCGTGRITKYLLERDASFVAVDLSMGSLAYLRRQVQPRYRGQLQLVQADVCRLPFRSDLFDEVVSMGLFCSLPGSEMRNRTLGQAVRVLRQGGAFLMSTYNFSLLKRIRGLLGVAATGSKEGHKKDRAYYYNHTPTELRDWLGTEFELSDLRGTDNRIPVIQHVSDDLNAWLDRIISRTPLSLPIFAREMAAKGTKR